MKQKKCKLKMFDHEPFMLYYFLVVLRCNCITAALEDTLSIIAWQLLEYR